MDTGKNSTTRFSDRVADYALYRPGYPVALLTLLARRIGFDQDSVVADIGSGTGLSAQLFLGNGNKVYGVEPNKEMREAAEQAFEANPLFESVNGTAEDTGLANQSVDVLFSAQAFHWFNVEEAKKECVRILKPGGNLVLAWNQRKLDDAFQQEYEQALFDCIEGYEAITRLKIDREKIARFFNPRPVQEEHLNYAQVFDLESLKGRTRSSSYCPKSGPAYEKLMQQLESLFYKYQTNGQLDFYYETIVFWC